MQGRSCGSILITLLALAAPVGSEGAQPAADLFAECEKSFAAAPHDPQSARCFYDLAKDTGRLQEGARRLEALRAAHPDNPWLVLNLGHVYLRGRPQQAEETYREAIAIAERLADEVAVVKARIALVRYLGRVSRFDEGDQVLDLAVRIAERLGDRQLLAEVLLRQAWQSLRQGKNMDLAFRQLRRIEEDIFPDGPAVLQVQCLDALASLSHHLGRPDEALSYKERLLAMAHEAGDLSTVAETSFDIAVAYLAAELPAPSAREKILGRFTEALAAAETVDHRSIAAQAHFEIGKLLGAEVGRGHLRSCLAIAGELGDTGRVLADRCRGALAVILAEENPQAANELIDRVLAAARESGDLWAETYVSADRLWVRWATLPRSEAIAESLDVLDALDALRERQSTGAGRAALTSVLSALHDWLFGRLLAAGERREDLELAFAVSERKRARVLLEALDAARAVDPAAPGPAVELATLTRVEAELASDEALLSFQFGLDEDFSDRFAGGSWLLVSTAGATRVHRVPDRVALEPRLHQLLGLADLADAEAGLAGVYRDLLAPALAELPPEIERLVIVPDGELHRLPFALLPQTAGSEPLIERYQLSVAPSATLWLRWRQRDPPASEVPVLAFADPLLDPSAGLAPLPHAREEGRAAVRTLGRESVLLAGKDATERNLKDRDLGRFGVLHFAAHAVIDDRFPERSAVVLAAGAGGDDGRLQPREIVELGLDGRVVVLASCEGAAGRVLRGEGAMSLARSFFHSGAPTVIAALWPLPDQPTAELFEIFYRRLAAGASVAGALAGAQREMLRRGAPARAWAGLVALGNGDLVPFPGGLDRERPLLTVGGPALVVVLSAVAVWALLRWRRRRARG